MLENDQTKLQPLLKLFDQIKDILQGSHQIRLLEIAVIGNPRSGKTSIIEAICQINLPIGENKITSTPIKIQLRNNKETLYQISYEIAQENIVKQKQESKENKTFSNLDEIEKLLSTATKNILDIEDKEIGQTQINLYLQSPQLPNLTFIDLPGMPCKDTPFEENVKQLYRKYLSNTSTIILMALSATEDLENNQTTLIAAEVDPERQRTMGIITQIDLPSDHLIKELQNNALNYQLGIFLVKNSSQKELLEKLPIEKVREIEKQLLSHEKFFLPKENKGFPEVIKMLIKMKNNWIINEQYRLKYEIMQKLTEIDIQKNKLLELKYKLTIYWQLGEIQIIIKN